MMQQMLPDPHNNYYSLRMPLKALGTYDKWIDIQLKLTDRAYINSRSSIKNMVDEIGVCHKENC